MKNQLYVYLVLSILAADCQTKEDKQPEVTAPNVVLIMGDDIGYSDIGAYGSEISTPNLDRLAHTGMRFRNFYNMAKCNPTRSSMITGLYKGDDRAISFVPLLKDAGYRVIMSGKEHFDPWVPQHCYFASTFDQSFTFWATTEYFVPPVDTFQRPFFLNGQKLAAEEIQADLLPKYKTDFITDYALRFMDQEIKPGKPFFLLLPYHAAHYPLQARPEDIAKYRGKYLKGWDKIRQERFDRMKDMGVLESNVKLSPAEDNTNKSRLSKALDFPEERAKFPKYYPWDSMNEQEKNDKDLEMAVFAAMIDRMDQNIGRVIKKIEEAGQMDNTIFIFFSDNGSCPFDSNVNFNISPGPAESYRCLSAAWANVGNTPYRLYKQNGHEGGANTHCLVSFPKMIKPGTFTNEVGHIVDIFPTLLDLAKIDYPAEYQAHTTLPLDGRSLVPAFKQQSLEGNPFFVAGTSEAFRMYREGDWKIVRQNNADWELYNLKNDPTELQDLATLEMGKYQELIRNYHALREERQFGRK